MTELYKDLYIWEFSDGSKMALEANSIVVGSPLTHVASKWDTLWGISFRYYGTHKLWFVIAEANDLIDPFQDLSNMNLIIPNNG
jgi:nucleoid-associated protein YgaU